MNHFLFVFYSIDRVIKLNWLLLFGLQIFSRVGVDNLGTREHLVLREGLDEKRSNPFFLKIQAFK